MSKIIQEAFREFNLLNEAEEFTLDVSGVDELSSFLDMAGGDDDTDVEVIDLEAEAKEDLKNSYMGKVIVDCNVCHSNIFMNKEDVVVDEEGNVNMETECPYCMSNEGYTIIGEVAPYGAETEEPEEDVEPEEEPIEDVESEEDDEELIGESLRRKRSKKINEAVYTLELYPTHTSEPKRTHYNSYEDAFNAAKSEINGKYDEIYINRRTAGGPSFENKWSREDGWYKESLKRKRSRRINESYETYTRQDLVGDEWLEDIAFMLDDAYGEGSWDRFDISDDIDDPIRVYNEDQLVSSVQIEGGRVFEVSADQDYMTPAEARKYWEENSDSDPILAEYNGDFSAWYKDSVENGYILESVKGRESRSVNEAVIDYDTDNRSANIETESELITVEDNADGGVSINTQPLDTLASEEEVIAPISDETVDEIEDANTEEPEFDDVDIEDPELDDALTAAAEDVGEEGELDFDEFDEESFDGLGESYLKKCYENVNSFKTTSVKRSGSNLIVEGLIKFTSGNEKKTNFVFTEAANNKGKVKLEGYNVQISKGKKSFKLRGSVNNRSFVCESLNYNYRGKNALDESVRVYGTVRKAK